MFRRISDFRRRSSVESTQSSLTLGSSSNANTSAGSIHPTLSRYDSYDTTTTLNEQAIGRRDQESGPLGLNVVYTPNNGRKADIIFIHGLGGTSRWTWSKNKDLALFWPLTFLPLEEDLCLARILTFGYNSAFHKAGDGKTSVLDFAEILLYDLKYAEDNQRKNLGIGDVPLIFVAHSMGGLVTKEALIQGSRRPHYESIINAVEAIVFMATPHRGAQIAQLLNKILQSSVISTSKQYVNDLLPKSFTLESQSESFRHIANKFKLISFFETQPTPIGLKRNKIMLLGKETSVLGYPDEISRPLDADHHNVCKYSSPMDPNYVIVRTALRAIMKNIIQRPNNLPPPDRANLETLQILLALGELPSVDFLFYRSQWKAGTCNWILEDNKYLDWSHAEEPVSHFLWLAGGAATGKSVLSAFIVNELEQRDLNYQYFFIRHGQPRKRTLSLLFRSVAYQMAQSSPEFLRKVISLEAEQIDFESMDPKAIWERLFRSILFRVEHIEPSYWVVDGLDEADDPRMFIELLSEISESCPMIRVFVTSRYTPELAVAFESLSPASITVERHLEDISYYIRREFLFTGSPEGKEKIIELLQERAGNNFLFVRLAVAELNLLQNRSYTEVEQAISRFPKGMEALYDRMATSIAQGTPNDNIMATKILQSVNCAYRPLTFVEMAQVLGEHHADQNHLHSSILAVCHGFILVVASSNYEDGNVPRISMIHHTAREYLLSSDTRPFKVDLRAAHTQMFKSCMECLMSSDLKDMVREKKSVEFLNYAACFWSRHLFSLSADSQVDTILTEFLTSKRSNKEWVLIWINYLAANNQLRVLTKASRQLLGYASKLKARSEGQHENGTQSLELRAILDSWAVDLIKIAGKWGMVLLRNPRLIYKSIPAFSPRSTPIFQQFGQAQTRNLAISGPPGMMEKWDDSLGRMTFGIRTQATAVASAGHHIAILAPEGKAFVYDASTFEQPTYGFIDHQERISKMAMNTRGTLVATCGWDTTNIWELHSGLCINSAQNPDGGPRPFTMIFTDDDNTLLVGFDDSKVRSLDLRHSSPTWEDFAVFEEKEISGHILNVPNSMVLNKDGTRLAVGYRGHPLSAWKLRRGKNPIHSGLCWRRGRSKKLRGEVEDMVWHPRFKLLLGVYVDGIVFKWRPGFSDSVSKNPRWEPKEIATGASKIAISRDGDLFVTGDPRGAIKIYTTIGFHLLYHLASEDMIGGITFSPDMRRLYDTRGYYASAWEPTALIRWAEQMRTTTDSFESKSETSTGETSVVSVNYSQTVDSITVVATPASRHSLYCTATVAGGVYLHHTQRGKLADIRVAEGLFGIDKMVFSRDSKYVCFTDSVKTLFIASIDFNEKTFATEVETKAEISLSQIVKGSILDLLFHHDSTHVLIQGSTSIRTISLTTFSVERSTDLDPAMENARWIPQPGDKAKILGISASNAELLTWNLEKLHSWTLTPRRTLSDWGFGDPTIEGKIDRIFPTSNGKHILVQVLPPSGQTFQTKTFFYIESSSLTTSLTPPNQPSIITPTILPQEMTSQIIHAHGFVSSNKLLYISKTYSINYWQIEFNQIGHDHPNIITHSGLGSDATIIPSRGLSNLNISSTPPPDITVTAPIKGAASEQERQSFVGRQSYMIKEIFPLPGDWISQDALAVSTLWGKERSFLCPRNGEVMLVRSPELRVV